MRYLLLILILMSPSAAAEDPFLVPIVEFLSAIAFKDNYKKIPELTDQSLSTQGDRLSKHNTDLNMIILSANCKRFMSPEGSGKACLVDDGTWQIVETYK